MPADVRAITDHYRTVAGEELAEEFYRELRRLIVRVAEQPGAFAVREHELRRANLERFLITFCSAWKMTCCGCWSSGTIANDHPTACGAAE